MTKKYTAKDIDVLSPLEGVRKNVGMYLGLESSQILHTLREVVENSIDLFEKKMNKYVSIVVETNKKKQSYIIIDHGPGIPIEKHKKSKISTLTTVLTRLHAGSNFDKKIKGKASTRGKHGVGVSTVTATSESFVVYTYRDNNWYTQKFAKGKTISEVTKTKLPKKYKAFGAKNKGTIIEYTPDYSVLPNTILKKKEVVDWSKAIANLNSGINIDLYFDKEKYSFSNKKGIVTLLQDYKEANANKAEFIGKPFIYEDKVLSVALQWGSLEGDEHLLSYVNGASTASGGTHVQGAYDAVSKAFKKVLPKASFSASDLREGLILVIHYKCTDDDYSGQNKDKLNSSTATSIVKKLLEKPLDSWIKNNLKYAKKIVRRASDIAKAKKQAKALTRAASNVKSSSKKSTMLLGKLAMCDKKTKAEEIELFLVEGDSAGGNAKQARNSKFQEILACRGKGLNVLKATLAKVLANKEIASILVSITGTDIKEIVKVGTISKFRVGKILLLPDADEDGKHISALWMTILLRFAPDAFKRGMVYQVKTPLYIDSEDKTVYGYSLKEIQKKMNPKHHSRIVRCKGLGEFTDSQLEPFINPETRKLIQLTYPSKKERSEFELLMGNDSSYRKKLLSIVE